MGTSRGVRFPQLPPNLKVGDLMLVSEAAKQLRMNPQTLRLGLQQGKFDFGVAIKLPNIVIPITFVKSDWSIT